jgi:molybdopterin molybdotransferase
MTERTVEQALGLLRPRIRPISESATVALSDAIGRVLAQPVLSAVDLPELDNAAMDGYAVRSADCDDHPTLTVIGQSLAGHAFAGRVGSGEAVRIMTGAVLPDGADAVVMREQAEEVGDRVRLLTQATPDMNVRRRGEHVRRSATVLAIGRRLCTHDIGLAASVGADRVTVFRRPRIGVLSTGDELVDAPAPLNPGSIYDGNRPLLAALVERAGCEVIDLGICADSGAALAERIDEAMRSQVDLLLTTGGAAQGEADVVRHLAEVEFIALDVRPGRGVLFGRCGGTPASAALLGLPGNAVAAYTTYQLVARPLIDCLAGAGVTTPLTLSLPVAEAVSGKPGRIEWRRASFVEREGTRALRPLKDQGSAMLRTVSEADALIAVPPAGVAAGARVAAIPLAALD